MSLPERGSTHSINSLLLIYRPQRDERLSWPGLLTCSGRLTHISGQPLATGWVQDKGQFADNDRRSSTVLCNQPWHYIYYWALLNIYKRADIFIKWNWVTYTLGHVLWVLVKIWWNFDFLNTFVDAGFERHVGVVSIVVRRHDCWQLKNISVRRVHVQMWRWKIWSMLPQLYLFTYLFYYCYKIGKIDMV